MTLFDVFFALREKSRKVLKIFLTLSYVAPFRWPLLRSADHFLSDTPRETGRNAKKNKTEMMFREKKNSFLCFNGRCCRRLLIAIAVVGSCRHCSSTRFWERGSGGAQSTSVSQRVRVTGRDESQSVPSPQKNSSKLGIWSSHFLRDLSHVVRSTPRDTPALLYTCTSPFPKIVAGGFCRENRLYIAENLALSSLVLISNKTQGPGEQGAAGCCPKILLPP